MRPNGVAESLKAYKELEAKGPAAGRLILDEPLAALDPLARQDFLATVMTAMADDGAT